MTSLFLHLAAGLVAGAMFRIQTLVLLVLLVLVEAACWAALGTVSVNALWWVVVEVALQVGYFGGVYLRILLERFGFAAFLYAGERS